VVSVAQDSPSPVPVRVPARQSAYDLVVTTGGSSRTWVVEAVGSVDLFTASHLADHLRAALAEQAALIVVDLRRVDFLATAGLIVLTAAAQRARAQGVTLRVVASTRAVSRALAVIGPASTLNVCSDLETALAS